MIKIERIGNGKMEMSFEGYKEDLMAESLAVIDHVYKMLDKDEQVGMIRALTKMINERW